MLFKVLIVCLMAVGALAHSLEELRTEIADMCKKNNSTDKTDDVMKAVTDAADCMKALVNKTNFTQEIVEAEQQGSLNEVFKKYCAKIPDFKVCLNGLKDGFNLCTGQYGYVIAELHKSLYSVLDFVCHNDGERINSFVTNGGLQCITEKEDKIEECRKPLTKSLETLESLDDVKKMNFEENCRMVDGWMSCTVKALQECPSPTPANVTDSLFQEIRKNTPCHKIREPVNFKKFFQLDKKKFFQLDKKL